MQRGVVFCDVRQKIDPHTGDTQFEGYSNGESQHSLTQKSLVGTQAAVNTKIAMKSTAQNLQQHENLGRTWGHWSPQRGAASWLHVHPPSRTL